MRGFLVACEITHYLEQDQLELLSKALDALYERDIEACPARLLTPEDFENNTNVDDDDNLPCYMENKDGECWWGVWKKDEFFRNYYKSGYMRPWTSRPTNEQMEGTPWQ